ncbi:hypothetical protein [Mariniflexile sp.]|uniref:hypothetical protein n=2 Tax=Mariniflexile sp. TaxID=1979402 RepID=UPI0040476065
MELKNEKVCFEMTLNGSAFTKFQLLNKKVNPLDWKLPTARLPETNIGSFDFQGHFLCLGTWGMPTEGEKKAGLKFYGEVNTEIWKVDAPLSNENNSQSITTSCKSPVEKLDIVRKVELFNNSSVIKISEKITNNLPIGRPYNILQHATMGGKFINQKTILNSNAGKGFYQNGQYTRNGYDDIESTSYDWPYAVLPDGKTDLRLSNQVQKSFVSTHIFPESEKYGWATLTNVEDRFLIGYVWDTNDYPWLNIWHQYEEGEVKGRAIEFATCGMWQPFEYMMSNESRFFGHNSFEFIDAGETKHKLYFMFLLPIDAHFTEVEKIQVNAHSLDISINYNGKNKVQILKF